MEPIKAVSPTESGNNLRLRYGAASSFTLRKELIPVDESCVKPLNLRISGKDDAALRNYKKMAIKQLDWCRRNQEAIIKKANKLYTLVQFESASGFLKRRCCDFKKLEVVLQKWIAKDVEHGKS